MNPSYMHFCDPQGHKYSLQYVFLEEPQPVISLNLRGIVSR
jgi:hypothetical protein